jgi:hypothetical protein
MTNVQVTSPLSVGTCELLSAIADRNGDRLLLPDVPLPVLVSSVHREIDRGNLSERLTLTAQGVATLDRLRGVGETARAFRMNPSHDHRADRLPPLRRGSRADAGRPHLELRLEVGVWQLGCVTCGQPFGEGDCDDSPETINAAVERSVHHLCTA